MRSLHSFMLPFALNVILVTPGWPLWTAFMQWPLNAIGMKNLPFQVMHECSMDKSSLHCQNGLMISGSFLQDSGQPFNICWISTCCVAFWTDSTSILDSCGVSSWMGDIYPFNFYLLIWADSAECICHWDVFTLNILDDKIIRLYLKQ